MKDRSYFWKLLFPALAMLVLTGMLLLESVGIDIEERDASIVLLDTETVQDARADADADILVACNRSSETEMAFATTLTDTLNEMHLAYQCVDISQETLPELTGYDTFLFCSQSLLPLESSVDALFAWVEAGGHFGLMMTPAIDSTFRILYRKLGITEYDTDYQNYTSLRYITDLLPLWDDEVYSEDSTLTDYALLVRLDSACTVHIVSGGDRQIPLLWERDSGQGRIVVLNTTLMFNKGGRGFAMSALSALEDVLVYPIINAGMIFTDDFPAPQPEGFNEQLKKNYGYDIQGFFRNHWWPDMKQLCWDYGVRYTGVLVETYNDNVTGPFTDENVDDSLLKYYTAELLHSGGEIGLHGYNHMPLCPDGFCYSGEDYTPWPTPLAMAQSLTELQRYGNTLFIDATYQTYVPPSNYLSDTGRKVLLETLPNIRVISGLYLREEGVDALVQEFQEADDGAIDVPRISSGFDMDDYMLFVAAQELVLHGVFSHFIHPDDILDAERGATIGWATMYSTFQARLQEIIDMYPQLRFLTASEGAAAVQRYDRLQISRQTTDTGMTLTLTPFYDTAWIALRTRRTPAAVTGGELFKIANGFYWIRADEAEVYVAWEAEP